MGKNQTKPSTPPISRRTGIDRRWITTLGYHPERRSGKDRRSNQRRSFLSPIELNDQRGQKNPFRDRHNSDESNRAEAPPGEFSAKPLSRVKETALADRAADD